jgi:hypothetical protein
MTNTAANSHAALSGPRERRGVVKIAQGS